MFQFAGAPYYVLVNIFVFSAYFQKSIVGDYTAGQEVWGYLQGAVGFVVALSSPVLGALADAAGPRKPGIIFFCGLSIAGMILMWWAVPGALTLAIIAVMIPAIFMEFSGVYHNAMLTGVAREHNVGWVSGLAFSLDYVGSVSLFLLWLQLPVLGLVILASEPFAHERMVGPMAALWLTVFMVPLLLFAPDRPKVSLSFQGAVNKGLSQLWATLKRVGHYRNIATYFVVRAIYADGMSGVFIFIAGLIGGIFGWSFGKIGLYALVVLVVPIFTSAPSGWIDDWIGSKRTIMISLFFFTLGVIGSLSTTPDVYLFVYPIDEALRAQQLPLLGPLFSALSFTTFPEQVSLAFSVLAGAFVGPVLASSRTMVARLSPPEMISELYGLYNLTGRATAFLVPLAVAYVTGVTQDQRIGFSVILVFLIAGLIGMAFVKEERATKAD